MAAPGVLGFVREQTNNKQWEKHALLSGKYENKKRNKNQNLWE